MLAVLEAEFAAAEQKVRLVTGAVGASSVLKTATVVHAMTVPNHGVLQQVAARYIHFSQFVAEAGEGLNLVGVDRLQLGQALRLAVVVL